MLFLVIILLLFTGYTGFAQNKFGITPQINVDFKIGSAWKVNSKFENRFIFYQNPYDGVGNGNEFENTDLEILVARNKGRLKNLGIGYLIRRSGKDGSFLHRIMQQYSLGQELNGLLLAHRFRSDQTFEQNEAIQYRLRYRISIEKPLNGLRVDPEEFYLRANNEYVGILKDGKANLEIRLLTALGYNQSEINQIEMGFDYRAKNVIRSGLENQLWLTIGWYHSF